MTDGSAERAELVLTTTRDGATVLIAVEGELDAHSAPALESLVAELLVGGASAFTLDLAQTGFIDSSGLRTLLGLHTELDERPSGALVLRAPSDPVTRLLEITGLTDHFTVS